VGTTIALTGSGPEQVRHNGEYAASTIEPGTWYCGESENDPEADYDPDKLSAGIWLAEEQGNPHSIVHESFPDYNDENALEQWGEENHTEGFQVWDTIYEPDLAQAATVNFFSCATDWELQ